MILRSQVSQHDVEEMIVFYKNHFQTVELVTCLNCRVPLALELSGGDPMGMSLNELGKIVVPIGENLLSSRIRLDETPEGQPMMGYQCGAQISNPAYPEAKAEHDKVVKEWEKAMKIYDKERAEWEKLSEKNPLKAPPAPDKPPMPILGVAEFIECGNDTRISEAERGLVPTGRSLIHLSPFERHKIKQEVMKSKAKTIFKKMGNLKVMDTFQIERIK